MRANMQTYAGLISKMTDIMEKTGDQVDPHYQEMKKWIQLDQVATLDQAQLIEVKQEFQKATDSYRSIEQAMIDMQAPIKLIGKHQMLKRDYVQYIEECQKMVDAIDADAKVIDVPAFNASEKAQAETMGQITKTLTRIMNLLVS